jgi:hypothetical protein
MAELVLPFHPEAEAELFEALDFYDELDLLQDTRLAVDLRNSIDAALDRVAESPQRFPPYLFGTRRYLLRRFPYSLVFDVEPVVVVLAFAHVKRRPGYWKDRRRR